MGWNGSDNCVANCTSHKTTNFDSKGRVSKCGVLASLFILVVAVIAIVMLVLPNNDVSEQHQQEHKTHRPGNAKAKVRTSHSEHKTWHPVKHVELTADVTPPSRLTKDIVEFGSLPTNCILRKSLFKRNSDNLIAGLVTAVPGDHFLSANQWNASFDSDFRSSLSEKIEIDENDAEEDRLIKHSVIETRKMLAEQMEKGWQPSEIMAEAQKELEKITIYRDQLTEIMQEYLKKDDLDGALKFRDEANELLKEYNAKPLSISERKLQKIQNRIQGNDQVL